MLVEWCCKTCSATQEIELEAPLKANLKADHSLLAQCAQCQRYASLSFRVAAAVSLLNEDHLKGLSIDQVWLASGTERCLHVQIVKFDSDAKSPIWIRTFDVEAGEPTGKSRRISYDKFFGPGAVMQITSA
jgi:hypothetical protein